MIACEKKGDEMSDESQYGEAFRALESGDGAAKTKVAFFKLSGRGGAEVDVDGAVDLLKERCEEEEDGEAMWMLGLCCEYGIGTKQDIERARLLYEQSRRKKNIVGKFLLNNGWGRNGEILVISLWNKISSNHDS